MDSIQKYDALLDRLGEYKSVLVAFSGGIDSTLLAVAAHVVHGHRCLAVLASSDTYPAREVDYATQLAAELGLRLLVVETSELADPRFRRNDPDRCFYCKSELFSLLRTVADHRGLESVLDGSNIDDRSDFRPGTRAAVEYGVQSPMADVGLTKAEMRQIAGQLGLPNWDKPSMACLASRFPYGENISEDKLQRVAQAEDALRDLGFRQFRVRIHGDIARVEIDPPEMDRAWELRSDISTRVKAAGFAFAAADLEGYRTGSLNETLNAEQLAAGQVERPPSLSGSEA